MSYQQWPPPQGLPYPGPPPKQPNRRRHDPLAVALGNASLLGLGYFLVRRWVFGVLGLMGTAVLVVLLYHRREAGYEYGLLGWWLLQIAHGSFLARRAAVRGASLAQRLVALGATVPVLAAVAFERYDAGRIDDEAIAAREAGNCAGVRAAQAKYALGHRVADAPRTVRVEADVAACDRIDVVAAELRTATGVADIRGIRSAFDRLAVILGQPEQTATVGKVVDRFMDSFPLGDPCRTKAVTDWLRSRKPAGTILDRPNTLVPRIEPNALLGCADAQAARASWTTARGTYLLLVDRYPRAKQAVRARAGVRKADQAILQAKVRAELERVRELVSSGEYCATPAKYSPAPRLRRGVNRAAFFGSEHTRKLPSQWRGSTADNSALVICAGEEARGSAVRTCRYTPFIGSGGPTDVTFYRIAVPVQVYELRTGRLIRTARVQISGSVCPPTISYTTYNGIGAPDPYQYVEPTTTTIQEAFRPLVVRP